MAKQIELPKALKRAHEQAEVFRTAKGWQPGNIAPRTPSMAADEAALYVYQVIGFDWWTGEGVTADSVRQALEPMKGVKTLNVYINSEGGSVFEAKAIYSQLKRFAKDSGAKVVAHIDGLCASAATYVAIAADEIITSPSGTWMIHEAWGAAVGDAKDLRAYADLLDMINDELAARYAEQTGMDASKCRDLMAAETWMTAEQAKAYGFTDAIAVDEPDEEETSAKAKFKPTAAVLATQRVLTANMAELLAHRAKQAGATPKETPASPGKRGAPASR